MGQLLGPAEIGLLSTVGAVSAIKIYKKPKIGLLSSGNELVDCAASDLPDGTIRDSNKAMMKAFLQSTGIEVLDFGTMRDFAEDIHEKMQKALSEVDLLVTTGGVSMGKKDLIKPYME